MTYPRYHRARAHRMVRKVAAVDSIASTSWTPVEADGTFDLTLEAQDGDTLRAVLAGTFPNTAVAKILNVATWVSGAAVNYFGPSSTAASHGPWLGASGAVAPIAGERRYVVQAGDLVSGKVTVRVLGRGDAATSWTPDASADSPLDFYLDNLGPADPE